MGEEGEGKDSGQRPVTVRSSDRRRHRLPYTVAENAKRGWAWEVTGSAGNGAGVRRQVGKWGG
ncbi:hypothetical protein V6Z11_A04G142800 [Gossypium hirsutum]